MIELLGDHDGLTPDQDEDSCEQSQHTGQDADAKPGERNNPNANEINREQKHADVFGNHVASIWNVPVRWQSKTYCADVSCVTGLTRRGEPAFLQRLEILDQVAFSVGESLVP